MTKDPFFNVMQFSVLFTKNFLCVWNLTEMSARNIVQLMLGAGNAGTAVAVELQNRSLQNALLAMAKDSRFHSNREHIEHFVDGYDRLLAYRNYYVHALLAVDGSAELEAHGRLMAISAKGKTTVNQELVSTSLIATIRQSALDLMRYGHAIEREMGEKSGAVAEIMAQMAETLDASLEKPKWPEKLKKSLLRY